MQLRPEIQLQSMIKAMNDTIIPVLAPDNKPAREQAQLIVETMRLMKKQLPIMYDFDRDELSRLVALAESLTGEAEDEEGLNGVVRSAKHALAGAKTTPEELEREIKRLRELIGESATRAYQSDDCKKKASVKSLILSCSREQLLRDRALLISQGWEPDASKIPSIGQLLSLTDDKE